MRRAFKYGALVLGGVLIPMIVIEGVLQVAAYINIRQSRMREARPGTASERVVLCIGDSFTFGVGAGSKSGSYPAQLERLLSRSSPPGGPGWRVVNKGWPGMNSAELKSRTPGFLEETAPDYVCILIGRNNRWKGADPVEPGGDEWRWELRTLKFLAILWANLTEGGEGAAAAGKGIGEADRLFRDGELDQARACLDALRPGIRASDDPAEAIRFTEILYRLRDDAAIVEECLFHIEKHGPRMPLCFMLIKPLGRLGRFDESLHWADEAMRCKEEGESAVPVLRARSWIYLKTGQVRPSLKDILEAYAEHRNDGLLESDLANVAAGGKDNLLYLPEVVKAMSFDAALGIRAQEVAYAVMTGREFQGGESAFRRRLREDLEAIIALVRAADAEPFLLTYPDPVREVEDCVGAVAGKEGVPVVNLIPLFRKRVDREGRDKYFIADAHCTEEGYRLISLEVAKLLYSMESP